MSYLVFSFPDGSQQLLADEHGANQYRHDHALPHIDKLGRLVSASRIKQQDQNTQAA